MFLCVHCLFLCAAHCAYSVNIYGVQTEVCAAGLVDIIHAVVSGVDGCLFCYGHARIGRSSTTHLSRPTLLITIIINFTLGVKDPEGFGKN